MFALRGFGPDSLAVIAERSGVSQAAATTMFGDEVELFAAVCEQEYLRTSLLVTAAFSRRSDPWDGMGDALAAFLDRACDPAVNRIVVKDGPGVLGWQRAQDMGATYCQFVVEEGLSRLAAARQLEGHDLPMLARLLHGALREASMRVARAADPAVARVETERELRGLFLGLARA